MSEKIKHEHNAWENEQKKMDYKNLLIEEQAAAGNEKAILEMAWNYTDNDSKDLDIDKGKLIADRLKKLESNEDMTEDTGKVAALLLGVMYYNGRGVEQNYKEAIKWYKKAADKSDSYALCNLGYCYYYGRDVEVDYEKAYSYFSEATLLKNPNAMYKLGDMFMDGKHVDIDEKAAFFWYMEAYNITDGNGYIEEPNIKYRLGKCFLYGQGVAQNSLVALRLLQEAALGFFTLMTQGDPYAKLSIPEVMGEINSLMSMMYEGWL